MSKRTGQLAEILGSGIWIGNFHACDHGADRFNRVVHVVTPDRPRCYLARLDVKRPWHTFIDWKEPLPLTEAHLEEMAIAVRLPGSVLLHCDAGLHRSTTLALAAVALRLRCDLPEAIAGVVMAMRHYAHRCPPVWIPGELRTVAAWISRN